MCADEMNKEQNQSFTKEEAKEYVYVMVSTLNQMVNYIPLRHFEFKEVVNITVGENQTSTKNEKKNLFNNKKWDDNLKNALKGALTVANIEIDKNIFFSLTNVKNILETEIAIGVLKGKKIFWNITGGQRHIIMAINQLAKDGDVLCYLEGNNNQMMIYDVSEKSTKPIDYALNLESDLNIDIALKLMGLQFKSSNQKIGEESERAFYKQFYAKYEASKALREWLIILNKNYPKTRDKKTNESDEDYKQHKEKYAKNKKAYEDLKAKAKSEIKKILSTLDQTILEKKLERSQAFGYILEELTFYRLERLLCKLLEDKKITLVYSLEIKNEERNNLAVAEFDIAILTNSGKFIMFECKSGVMEGDTAKARKYVTYAVGGVYGLPILINPVLSTETMESNIVKDLDIDIYKYIKEAKDSAERAHLEVWGLDEIEKNIKKYTEQMDAEKC